MQRCLKNPIHFILVMRETVTVGKRWLIDSVKIYSTLNTNQFQHNINCQCMSNYRL